ncbi:MAG: division/cell wall cluster transcriptional repressor MraZ [Candidatus Atribacteria bacterium]|nr:division/cell wall cluster transcriptional repressor MraZ [Candidatus Atribacteria bacterium]
MMFLSHYRHTVDKKGRIVIPSEFRDALRERIYLTPGIESCIFIYPQEEWEKLYRKVASLPLTQKDARDFMRLFLSSAATVEIDPQGRVMLPLHLRKYAQIENRVILLGVGNRVEIWSEEHWDAYFQKIQGSFEAITQSIVMEEPSYER